MQGEGRNALSFLTTTKTHKYLPMTEGNMVQLRVLRSLAHRQEVYSLPDRGVRV